MKNQRQKLTAIKGLLFAALLTFGGAAWAQVVGVVAHLSGPLIAKKANGTVKVLAAKSEVENGDTLVSEKNTYAQIKFIDNGEITLRPNTTFKIENFAYDAGKPEGDSAKFDLVKGGLRSITGLLGKRNKEKFEMKTPSATIGIRGTTFVATYVPPSTPTANGMQINPNPSILQEYDPGKLANPGTGTINRSPDGGVSGLNTGGKVSSAAQPGNPGGNVTPGGAVPPTAGTGSGGAGQGGQSPAAVASSAIGATQSLLNGGAGGKPGSQPAGAQPPGGQQFLNDISNFTREQMENARANGAIPPGTGTAPPAGPPALGGAQPQGTPVLAPGLHLNVTDGAIVVTNNGGSLGFQAGQFGYVPNVNQPPVIVPSNPAIQFVPPPSFSSGTGSPTASTGPGQGQAADCIVR
jgi:hypothetical protein